MNKTTGTVALPIFWRFLEKWPNPKDVMEAPENEIADLLQPMGLHNRRAKVLIRFTEEYVFKEWIYPKELYGIGKYGNDSYRIFCINEWRHVKPKDKKLNLYHGWLFKTYDDTKHLNRCENLV